MVSVNEGADVAQAPERGVFMRLLPVLAAVFTIGIVLGATIPVVPLYIHRDLGLGTVVVGLATGAQFAAAVLSRTLAGHYADRRGARRVVVSGAALGAVSGAIYLLSLAFVETPGIAAGVLVVARLLQGFSESLIVTGSIAWGFARLGHRDAGSIIAWVGNAAFGSMAIGAIVGTTLFGFGFWAIALLALLVPLVLLAATAWLPFAPPAATAAPVGLLR